MDLQTAAAVIAASPSQLFPDPDPTAVRKRFAALALKWHPDHCLDPQAEQAMDHIKNSRDKILNGPKLEVASFRMAHSDKLFQFRYLTRRKWEAGEIFVTPSTVAYLVSPTFRDLAFASEKHRWKFATDRLRDEMTKFLPNLVRSVETESTGTLMIYRRNPDQVLMSDLLEKIQGTVPVPHAMWFVSSLMNICAYLYTAETTHFALMPEMLLVSPPMHSVAVTGPVLYATKFPDRPNAVPSSVLARYPSLRDKKARVPHFVADTNQVRQIAMAALGAHDLVQLRARTDVPEGFKRWIMSRPQENSIEDYAAWEQARGVRKFTPYEITAQGIYEGVI